MPRAASVAAVMAKQTAIEPDLVEGDRGEFTVWVGEKVVAQKDAAGFPSESDVLSAVQSALAAA